MNDQRNLILAIVISVVIVVGFQFIFGYSNPPPQKPLDSATHTTSPDDSSPIPSSNDDRNTASRLANTNASPTVVISGDRDEIIAGTERVFFETPHVRGSISLVGGLIDDLTLTNYHETIEPGSPEIVLLSPRGTQISGAQNSSSMFLPQNEVANRGPYYAWFGWSNVPKKDEAEVPLDKRTLTPDPWTIWTADRTTLAPGKPVTLSWENGHGVRFIQIIGIDDKYMFTIQRRIENHGSTAARVRPFGSIVRTGTPWVSGFYILHEGPLGVFEGTLEEHDYDDFLDEPKGKISTLSTGGWLGITDKYWLVTLIPDQNKKFEGTFSQELDDKGNSIKPDQYRVYYLDDEWQEIAPGASAESTDHLFTGAKVAATLDSYEQQLNIVRFDLAVAFRWLYFLAMPLFHVLMMFNELIGNFGVAILLLTVCVKLVFFPLANKAYRSMAAMKKLQPEVTKMKEQYAGDRAGMQKAMMDLYKAEKVNPMMGCLPMLIQIPVFFALYEVLFVTIEMRQAPFFGWVQDLSSRDPSNLLNPFGIMPFEYPDILHIGIWPILMGVSMWLQMRLNPQPQDPIQAKIFLFMPFFFTFLLASFPAGLVIYWTWNNLLSILQQWVIMKRMGVARPAS